MKNLLILKAACDTAIKNPAFAPANGVTHCNEGAIFIANALGCHELDNLMADQQYKVMVVNKSGLWVKADGTAATVWALSGGLAFAIMSSEQLEETHGHIATIYPAPMQFSGSLNKNVPVVANIGTNEAEEKDSMAFPVTKGEANYFIWKG